MLNMVFIRYLKLRDNDWENSGTLSTFVLTSSLVEDLFILSSCSIIKVFYWVFPIWVWSPNFRAIQENWYDTCIKNIYRQ